ncbi:MAG: hypothetical protein M1812_000077 [Candelaria pacifica]|nr:MAG: hypothetical protein M1812_000077 [Candelaria pacifica]
MSGFFSQEAENYLMGEGEEIERLFPPQATVQTTTPTYSYATPQSSWSYTAPQDSHTPQYSWSSTVPAQGYAQPQVVTSPYLVSSTQNPAYYPQGESSRQMPERNNSLSDSPDPSDLQNYGSPNGDGTWSCAYPGCANRSGGFTRGCDLRKHYRRHSKYIFCRHEECPQSTEGGFSSKKDRDRHEAKHNPGVLCEWDGCERIFSRVDNMKDHVRRIHKKRR